MEKSAKLLAALLSGIMLSGCSRLMLEQRTFIRDIFIRETAEGVSVSLWQEEEEQLTEGTGKTIREALYQAESRLEGEAFYGQNRRIILDAELPWIRLRECGTHFAAEESRMPNVSLWFGRELPEQEGCKEYLDNLESLENQFSLTANLYELTRRESAVMLPTFDGESLLAAARTEAKTLEWQQPYALLTLFMAQQAGSGSLMLDTPQGRLLVEAGAVSTAMESDREKIEVRVSIRNAGWKLLDGGEPPKRETVEKMLEEKSELWIQEIQNEGVDLFFFSERLKNYDKPTAERLKNKFNDIPIKFIYELR